MEYTELKRSKDILYDHIIGELNRISVSDDYGEKKDLYICLTENISAYYKICVKCTHEYLKIKE